MLTQGAHLSDIRHVNKTVLAHFLERGLLFFERELCCKAFPWLQRPESPQKCHWHQNYSILGELPESQVLKKRPHNLILFAHHLYYCN